jgi:hypothetical protein
MRPLGRIVNIHSLSLGDSQMELLSRLGKSWPAGAKLDPTDDLSCLLRPLKGFQFISRTINSYPVIRKC